MADHDESLIDKVKNALGMGDDGERHETARTGEPGTHEDLDADRGEGWAGVPGAANPGSPRHSVAGTRDDEMGMHTSPSGVEAETLGRDTAEGQFAGSGYDTSYEAAGDVRPDDQRLDDAPPGAAGTDPDAPLTRGEAASGRSPLAGDEERSVDRERRESGM